MSAPGASARVRAVLDDEREQQTTRQQETRSQGLAYQASFEAVFAILICAGAGYWIDTRFETSPWGLLVGTVVGFASFVLRLLRLGRQLEKGAAGAASEDREDTGR